MSGKGVSALRCWLIYLLPGLVSAQLSSSEKQNLIIGCSIGGAVVLIIIIVLLVLCYRSSQERKSLRRSPVAKNIPASHKIYNHRNVSKSSHKTSNGQVNGHGPKSAPKLERSLSESHAGLSSAFMIPDWKRKHDRRDSGSQLSGFRDNGSDISGGIWTSNPSLSRAFPGHVTMSTSPNGHSPRNVYGSESALLPSVAQKQHRLPYIRGHAEDNYLSNGDTNKLIHRGDADFVDAENERVVKAYNNPVAPDKKKPQRASSFVAKAYNDYKKPQAATEANKPRGAKIVKAYSAYSKNPDARAHATQNLNTDGKQAEKDKILYYAKMNRASPDSSRRHPVRKDGFPSREKQVNKNIPDSSRRHDIIRINPGVRSGQPLNVTDDVHRGHINVGPPGHKQTSDLLVHQKNQVSESKKQTGRPDKKRKAPDVPEPKAGIHRQNPTRPQSGPSVEGQWILQPKLVQSENLASESSALRSENAKDGPTEFDGRQNTDSTSKTHGTEDERGSSVVNVTSEGPVDIYAVPIKRQNKQDQSHDIVVQESSGATYPVQNVTSISTSAIEDVDDAVTPTLPPKDHWKSSSDNLSDGDGLSTGKAIQAFEFLEAYSPKEENELNEDRISINTTATGREGKRIIGDAFQFLDDFDDNASLNGEPEIF